jgi:hypothetical protein
MRRESRKLEARMGTDFVGELADGSDQERLVPDGEAEDESP